MMEAKEKGDFDDAPPDTAAGGGDFDDVDTSGKGQDDDLRAKDARRQSKGDDSYKAKESSSKESAPKEKGKTAKKGSTQKGDVSDTDDSKDVAQGQDENSW